MAQVAVIGAGPAGLVTGIALSRLSVDAVVVAPAYAPARSEADRRTTALLGPSVDLLKNLGIWQLCADEAAPLTAVRIVDDRSGLIRAPEVLFEAAELGLASFGANIANPALVAALNGTAAGASRLTRCTAIVDGIRHCNSHLCLDLQEGESVAVQLAVAADGRNSIAPTAAGIAVRRWLYPQAAIVTSFRHSRPHDGIVIELHRRSGPLTTVPLPGLASSLVWAEAPDEARRLQVLDDDAFASELEARLQGLLGSVEEVGPRGVYPLCGLKAERMAAARIALVGEAAHVIPPIGAQGLNLGLRDAATLAECVADALALGKDPGAPETLAVYERARAADVLSRSLSVDLLNRSLLLDFLPLEVLRGIGGHLVANIAPLRRLLMQGGMAPPGDLPRLMRAGTMLQGP